MKPETDFGACDVEIPFNRPHMTGKELYYIAAAHFNGMLAGDGPFTKQCHTWLEKNTGSVKALLTHSCTAALEMSALLLDIRPGDEVIMPSYTFVSTANAFVQRGGVPVFIDIRNDTLNLDENLVEQAITENTKAIVPVHYAGVGCEMDAIMDIAARHDLGVVEDAAQGVMATYNEKPLGSIGHMGTYSFHETKNLISGEGGSLLLNDERYVEKAEIIREKGTDRSRFFRGEIDKYTWQEVGSSYLPGELTSAFLWAQLEEAERITNERINLWENYHRLLEEMERKDKLRRPIVPEKCQHNGHMYYVLFADKRTRDAVEERMKTNGVRALFHYIPLHSSPAGIRFGKTHGELNNTDEKSGQLLRLPLWCGMTLSQQEKVVSTLEKAL